MDKNKARRAANHPCRLADVDSAESPNAWIIPSV
jgi:hypothetical protein